MIPAGDGEIVGDSADRRVEILSDHEALNATWSRFGPHRDGADPHVHREHTDLFYVLEGELTVRLGADDDRVVLPAGTLALMPPMVVHGFLNDADEEVRYLNFHAPGRGFADYMRSIRDGQKISYDQFPPPDSGTRPTSDAAVGKGEPLTGRPGLRIVRLADVPEIAIDEICREAGGPPAAEHAEDSVHALYVLEGDLVMTTDDGELTVPAGTWAQLAPGTTLTLTVAGKEPARYLSIRTPA